MKTDSEKMSYLYSSVLVKVLSTITWYQEHKNQSLTIPELSVILGNSEELILESMEFGGLTKQSCTLLH